MQQGFSLVVRRKDVRPGGRERAKVIPVGGTVPPEVWALGLEVLEQGGLAAIVPGVDVDAQVQELLEERNPVVCRLWREPRRRARWWRGVLPSGSGSRGSAPASRSS